MFVKASTVTWSYYLTERPCTSHQNINRQLVEIACLLQYIATYKPCTQHIRIKPMNAANSCEFDRTKAQNIGAQTDWVILACLDILCILYISQTSVNSRCESYEYSSLVWRSVFRGPHWITAYNLYGQKLESTGYIFSGDSICAALQISEQFWPIARTRKPTRSRSQDRLQRKMAIQGHSKSSISLSMKSHYIAQYNNCGLECEASEDIASETSENRHFRRLHSHLKPPLQLTYANIRINLILLETAVFGLHFCRW